MTNLTNSELKAKATEYRNGMLEGGEGFNPFESEIERRGLEEATKQNDEWTLETTKARRIAFNARKPTGSTLAKIQRELGFTFSELKEAIASHGL